MIYAFEDYSLDTDRRELRHGANLVAVEPQVFDLLLFLVRNRTRVVTKDDLIAEVWNGRIVSESTLSSRITAVRQAIGDSGEQQRLIRTVARRGHRFVAQVREEERSEKANAAKPAAQSDEPLPAGAAPSGGSERRQLTIMACNIVDSMSLSARLDPEDLQEVVAAYHSRVQDIVESHGGSVAQCTGDGTVAYFGYPQAHEEDAERAVRAGLSVSKAVGELGIKGLAKTLQARIGIATGLVVVENRSNGSTAGPVAVGGTPLLATRLLSLAVPGAIVVSGGTRRLLGTLFDYRDLPDAELSGTAEPIDACQVLSESGIANRFEALRSRRNRLIGREEEVELLRRRWEQVKETGQGRVVLVSGEPGIGKSRLVATLEDTIETEPHASLRYFCSPHHTQSALHPVITQLERTARIAGDDSVDARLDKLEALLAPSCESLSQVVPLFGLLLSIPAGERYSLPNGTPQQLKERTIRALLAHLKHLAARQPVLMVFEDLHWIDPTSLDLLSLIVDQMKGQRLLLLATARPEFMPPWPSHRHISALALTRLDRSEVGAVAAGITGGKTLPSDVLDQIFSRTDGVPLFIEELTTSLLESGLLRETANHYVLKGPLPPIAIPTTLHALLVARLDRLGTVKDVAQMGAVIGREFSYELLAAVASLTRTVLDAALERLTASGLISRRGTPPEATYTFKHALVQDAAYQSLLRSTRQQYHLRIAHALEHQFPARTQGEPEIAAYHCAEAGMNSRAVRYLRQAGLRAMVRAANREAVVHLEQALGALHRLPETQETMGLKVDIRLDLRNALFPLGDQGRIGEHLREAEVVARLLADQHRLARIANFMVVQCLHSGDYDEAVRFGQEAMRIAPTLNDRSIDVNATVFLGVAHVVRGEFSDGVTLLERTAGLDGKLRYESFGSSGIQSAMSGAWLAHALSQLGQFDEAIMRADAAVRIAEAADHPFTLYFGLFDLGLAHLRRGDLPRATQVLERGLDLCRTSPIVGWAPLVAAALGTTYALAGRAEEALALVAGAVEEFSARQIHRWPALILLCAGMTNLSAGRIDEAAIHAREALALTRRVGARGSEAHAICLVGDVASIGSTGAAEGYYREALALARALGMRPTAANCHLGLGKLYRRTGKGEHAQEHLAIATAMYSEMRMGFWLRKAELEMLRLG